MRKQLSSTIYYLAYPFSPKLPRQPCFHMYFGKIHGSVSELSILSICELKKKDNHEPVFHCLIIDYSQS